MSDLSFYVSALFGAIALFFEAHRQFSTRTKVTSEGRYPLLDGVELDTLAPPNIYLRGYWFYILCYMFVFTIALSAVGIGDLIITSASSVRESGAHGSVSFGDASFLPLSSESDARPLVIAIGMITLLSTGLISQIETFMRDIAHGLAGIPHRIFRLIQRLNRVGYEEFAEPGPSTKKFDKMLKTLRTSMPEAFPSTSQMDDARNNFLIVDVLSPALVGPFRDQVFPVSNVDRLTSLTNELDEELNALTIKVDALIESSGQDAIEEVPVILGAVSRLRRNMQALFAVLYTKSRPSDIGRAHKPTTDILDRLAKRERGHTLDSLIWASGACFFIILIVAAFWEIRLMTLKYDGDMGWIFPETGTDDAAMVAFGKDRFTVLMNTITFSLTLTGMALSAGILAILLRRNKLDLEKWAAYSLNRPPASRLMGAVTLPAMGAGAIVVAIVVGLDVLVVAIQNGALITAKDFLISLSIAADDGFFAMGYGLMIALAVLLVADQHDNLPMYRTVSLSLFFVLPIAVIAVLESFATVGTSGFRYAIEKIGLVVIYAVLLLGLFAYFVECTEGGADGD